MVNARHSVQSKPFFACGFRNFLECSNNLKMKCRITLKNESQFVLVCHLYNEDKPNSPILLIPPGIPLFLLCTLLPPYETKNALNLGWGKQLVAVKTEAMWLQVYN